MKKISAGDRCEVESADSWIPATILTVYPGHSGAMVLPDNWATSVWAKASQIREMTVNPSSAKRGDYTHGQTVEVQRAMGRWVEGDFDRWEDETHERAYVYTGAFESERFHFTNVRIPRVAPDPHSAAYQGEVGDHQPCKTATVEIMPDVSGFLNNLRRLARRPLSPGGLIPTPRDLADALSDMGKAVVSAQEKIGYIDVATKFAQCGIDPEQLNEYVEAFGRIIVHGITPHELHQYITDHLRHRAGYPTAKLHHINHTYRAH